MSDSPREEVCSNCRFSKEYKKHMGILICRRFPPQVNGDDSQFPIVSEEAWCGEWKQNQEEHER